MPQSSNRSLVIKDFTKIQEEYVCNAAITPGMLVEVMTTDKIRAHATADGNRERKFAFEDELQGKSIDDAYAADDRAQVKIFRSGDQVLGILADGETAVIGSPLVSNGDGTLKIWALETESIHIGGTSTQDIEVNFQYPEALVGYAIEALDMSGSSGEESSALLTNARLKLRIK